MTKLVHGNEELANVQLISDFLYSKPFNRNNLSDDMLAVLHSNSRLINVNSSCLLKNVILDRQLIPDYSKLPLF